MVSREFGHLLPRQPSYRFYRDKETGDRYFWTTEKCKHKNGLKYVAGIYRYLKTKKAMKLVKRVGFASRKKAKAWAYNARFNKKTTLAE